MNAHCTVHIQLTLPQNSIYLKFKWLKEGALKKKFGFCHAALANDDDDDDEDHSLVTTVCKWITILTLDCFTCERKFYVTFKVKFEIIKINYIAWHCNFA